jgi:hypothetical protein
MVVMWNQAARLGNLGPPIVARALGVTHQRIDNAAANAAACDAGIVAWHLKRLDSGARPITSVRHLKQDVPILPWGRPGRPLETTDGGKWSPSNPGSNLKHGFPGCISSPLFGDALTQTNGRRRHTRQRRACRAVVSGEMRGRG